MIVVSSCSCLWPIHWSQLLSSEWRCNWSSADRRCSNFIWVINNCIASSGASYIRGFTIFRISRNFTLDVMMQYAVYNMHQNVKTSIHSLSKFPLAHAWTCYNYAIYWQHVHFILRWHHSITSYVVRCVKWWTVHKSCRKKLSLILNRKSLKDFNVAMWI